MGSGVQVLGQGKDEHPPFPLTFLHGRAQARPTGSSLQAARHLIPEARMTWSWWGNPSLRGADSYPARHPLDGCWGLEGGSQGEPWRQSCRRWGLGARQSMLAQARK